MCLQSKAKVALFARGVRVAAVGKLADRKTWQTGGLCTGDESEGARVRRGSEEKFFLLLRLQGSVVVRTLRQAYPVARIDGCRLRRVNACDLHHVHDTLRL